MAICNYIWRDPKTNIFRYVGWGSDHHKRPFDHLRGSHNRQLDFMLKKRLCEGFDPQPEIIICLYQSKNYAKLVECCLIEKYGREDLNKGTLFNRTDGGDGAPNLSAESLEKMSRASKNKSPEALRSIGEAARNRSPEVKEKQRESGRNKSLDARKSIGEHNRNAPLELKQRRYAGLALYVQNPYPVSDATREKMKTSALVRPPASAETCEKIRQKALARWAKVRAEKEAAEKATAEAKMAAIKLCNTERK